jgi:ABC-type multidrug transport system ATPase subunit
LDRLKLKKNLTALNIKNLLKRYGSYTVLDFMELQLDQGIYWIKGGNGTGKTTLFRILAGQTPFSGSLTLNQIDIRKRPAAYRSMISYAEAEMVLTSVRGNENIYLKFLLLMFASSTVAILAHQVLLFSLLLSVLSIAYFCYSYYRVDYKCMNMDD